MNFLIALLLWSLLLVLCWPLALALVVLLPVLWLIALPFRVVAVVVTGVLSLIKAILCLPARLLGAS